MIAGYIKVHRSLLEWEWYSDDRCVRLLLHLLLKANYTDRKWKGQELKPGQLITSTVSLAEQLGWSRSALNRTLDKLKSGQEIDTQADNKWTLITLRKWEQFQVDAEEPDSNRTADRTATGQQTGQQPDTAKEGKKERRVRREEVVEPKGSGRSAQPSIPFDPEKTNEGAPDSAPTKPDARHPDVQAVLDHLVLRLRERGVASLDVDRISTKTGRSLDMNRAHAKNLLAKLDKDYPGYNALASAKALIDYAVRNEFHGPKCTKVAYLYRNLGTLAGEAKAAKNSKPKTHADLNAGVEQILRAKYGDFHNGGS